LLKERTRTIRRMLLPTGAPSDGHSVQWSFYPTERNNTPFLYVNFFGRETTWAHMICFVQSHEVIQQERTCSASVRLLHHSKFFEAYSCALSSNVFIVATSFFCIFFLLSILAYLNLATKRGHAPLTNKKKKKKKKICFVCLIFF